MAPRSSLSWMQTRLGALSVAFGASSALSFGAILVYLCVFLMTLYYYIPLNTFTPPQFYASDQDATPLGSLTLDVSGRATNYTLATSVLLPGAAFVAGGEAVELIHANDTVTVQLRTRAITPGAYFMPDVNVTNEGVLTGIRDGTPIGAADVTHGGGTVADALASAFLVAQASADLANERVLSPSGSDFDVDVGTPGQYLLSVEPSPVASTSCAHPTSVTFGTGTKTAACVAGPAPGTPGGAATLGLDGNIPASQLPVTMNLDFRGLWDPDLNDPPLATPDCGASDNFYYFVANSGNHSIASFFVWSAKELLLCQNGTWSKVDSIVAGLMSFNGRTGDVDAEFGDYPSDLIPVPGGTLTDVGLAPFIVTAATPLLPNAQVLQATAGQTTLTGASVGLADVPAWGGANVSLPGVLRDVCIDRHGRITCGSSTAVNLSSVSSSQITVTGTTDLVLSLPQGTTTTSPVQFGSVTVNATRVTGSGSGTATVPNLGSGQFLLTEGAKTITGAKSFDASLIVAGDQGIQINNAANTASLTIRHATTGTGAILFAYPPDYGTNGSVLVSNGAGQHAWQPAVTPLSWTSYSPSISLFFNVDTGFVSSAYYRGAGTVGSLMEVRVTLDLTVFTGVSRWAMLVQLPVGVIGSPIDGRTIGYCTVTGTIFERRTVGWIADYVFDPTFAYIGIEEQDDNEISGLWVCHFAYVVAAP